ncbi:MAG TPA: GvpL/GvpF family gas vesicle protein [Methylomirabilota bacterium]|nr:GvpL/GvpF family gas vesicle protein [Methylomirabilota bacterium]
MSRERPATYVYCVLQAGRKPVLQRPPKGLEAMGAPRLLPLADTLWLVVADAPLGQYGSEPIERRLTDLGWVSRCALAHEAVVEHMARHGVVVPMKIFTLFASDERAQAHFARTRKRIEGLIRRVAGRDEWGVQVGLDERLALKARVDGRPSRAGAPSGTSFLLRKKAEKDAVKRLISDATREAERIFATLARHADDERRRTPEQAGGSVRLLLDATFLVPSPRAARFQEAVAALARRLQPRGYRVRLTGPWPPYTFVASSP